MKRLFRITLALLTGIVAGCAMHGATAPNTTADDLTKKLGKPSDTRPLAQGGEVWDYVTGPEGYTTWRYTIDSQRRVRSADQLLTYERLHKVAPGVTTEAGVIELLGRPRLVTRYSHETAWEWRVNLQPDRGIFYVRFGHDRIARGVGVLADVAIDGDRGDP
jgi:hypothetical protein